MFLLLLPSQFKYFYRNPRIFTPQNIYIFIYILFFKNFYTNLKYSLSILSWCKKNKHNTYIYTKSYFLEVWKCTDSRKGYLNWDGGSIIQKKKNLSENFYTHGQPNDFHLINSFHKFSTRLNPHLNKGKKFMNTFPSSVKF